MGEKSKPQYLLAAMLQITWPVSPDVLQIDTGASRDYESGIIMFRVNDRRDNNLKEGDELPREANVKNEATWSYSESFKCENKTDPQHEPSSARHTSHVMPTTRTV